MKLTYTALLSNSFANHTRNTLSNSEILTYYIHNQTGWSSLERHYQGILIESQEITTYNVGHTTFIQNFIRDTFSRLDKVIDLDFLEMDNNNGSMIDIYHVDYASIFEENVIGLALPQNSSQGYWWDILWEDVKNHQSSNPNLNTIVHEIGHCLGLSHPFNDPYNKSYDSKDTVMSYNIGPNGWEDWFSETDLNALIKTWGREDDDGIIQYNKVSKNFKFKKKSSNRYYIETDIGLEEITNINTLIFQDKSFDLQKDIIGVFNLIKAKNDITGKIYRLYNACLGRFPDHNGLKYWIEQNISGLDTYRKTATSFIVSNEFNSLYGSNSNDRDYITNLYSNILSRSPDQGGFNYWLNQLSGGHENRSEILMGFSESLENKTIFSNETNIF